MISREIPRTTLNYTRTATGKKFWPLNPRVEDVNIMDIAHALSQINRWTGATCRPFSVALHSLAVMALVPEPYKLEALLHDASEAYLLDVPKPLKVLFPDYKVFEHNLLRTIHKALQPPGMPAYEKKSEVVDAADKWMLCAEGSALIPDYVMGEGELELPREHWALDQQAKVQVHEMLRIITAQSWHDVPPPWTQTRFPLMLPWKIILTPSGCKEAFLDAYYNLTTPRTED